MSRQEASATADLEYQTIQTSLCQVRVEERTGTWQLGQEG